MQPVYIYYEVLSIRHLHHAAMHLWMKMVWIWSFCSMRSSTTGMCLFQIQLHSMRCISLHHSAQKQFWAFTHRLNSISTCGNRRGSPRNAPLQEVQWGKIILPPVSSNALMLGHLPRQQKIPVPLFSYPERIWTWLSHLLPSEVL